MNKFFIILLLLLNSCDNKAQTTINLAHLKIAYQNKDEIKFLENFPKNFKEFKSTFGWNDKLDKPNKYYSEAYIYIDYLFKLVSVPEHKEFKKIILNIASEAKWEADGVNYFNINLHNFVETDDDITELLQNLSDKKVNSFWMFYFDKVDLNYSPKLEGILNKQMKNVSMSVFKTLIKERKKENILENKPSEYEIFDKDGYSNLRKEKNSSSEVVEKIKNGEKIEILDRTTDWWYSETKKGNKGFIHKSRLIIK